MKFFFYVIFNLGNWLLLILGILILYFENCMNWIVVVCVILYKYENEIVGIFLVLWVLLSFVDEYYVMKVIGCKFILYSILIIFF